MSSNIVFKSNIYPVKDGFYTSDIDFLSNVWDYERLHYINKRISVDLPNMQAKVLNEQPYCSLNKEDPCWGVILTQRGYEWACRCTRTDCVQFERCRALIPYDKKYDDYFTPKAEVADEYGYEDEKNRNALNAVTLQNNEKDYNYKKPRVKILNLGKEISMTELSHKEPHASDENEIAIEEIDVSASNGDSEKSEKNVISGGNKADVNKKTESIKKGAEGEEKQPDRTEIIGNIFELFHETSQESIITSPCDKTMFVDAGPGTGKTYTIIQKLNYMVSNLEIDPESIVVLCFTNAAVYEIRNRLREFVRNGADRGLANVDVRTFHSFAWWVIDQANNYFVEDGWKPVIMHNLSYDASLVKAIQAIEQFGEAIFCNWKHFVVDEVQDLTAERGQLVLSMIGECMQQRCGLTVMGDACQAIYDYESKNLSSDEFYKRLVKMLGDDAEYCFLKDNHRQTNELIDLTDELRTAILSGNKDCMKEAVSRLLSKIEKTDNNDTPESSDVRCWLMRNNGQTLKFSSDWRKKGIHHYLNTTETPYNYSPWIADLFEDVKNPTLDQQAFFDICQKKKIVSPEEKWSHLNKCMHIKNNVLNVRDVVDAIADSRIDDLILRESNNDNRIVSNIHRAKGREYDEVVVDTDFVKELAENTGDIGEYKTLYVALTRPKKVLKTASLQKNTIRKIKIYKTGRSRWGQYRNGKIQYLEFDSKGDLIPEAFLGTKNELFNKVDIGDEIILKRVNSSDLKYLVVHEKTDNCLGVLENSNYIIDFMHGMSLEKEQYIDMPESINDLYVSGIYSRVVDHKILESSPEISELAQNGVWKWIDIVGVGHASYDVY